MNRPTYPDEPEREGWKRWALAGAFGALLGAAIIHRLTS